MHSKNHSVPQKEWKSRVFVALLRFPKLVVPVKYDKQGQPIGYAKKGNNHHVAIYKDKNGQYQEMVVSF